MSSKIELANLNYKYIGKIPKLSTIFISIFIFFYLLPSSLIYFNYDINQMLPTVVFDRLSSIFTSKSALQYYFWAPFLFLLGFISPKIFSLPYKNKKNKYQLYLDGLNFRNFLFKPAINLIYVGGWLGFLVTYAYFIFIAIDLINQLGTTELDDDSFRFFLFDDRYRFANYILEISRRILLPIATTYIMFQSLLLKGKLSFISKFFWFTLFFAGIMTLDRAPVFIAIALLIMYFIIKADSIRRYAFYLICSLAILLIIGGLVTNLQYNQTQFSLINLIYQGFAVLINRLFYDPALMSLTYSFAIIDGVNDPLYLEYSRLGVLWGQSYVGTSSESSIYVAPVSFIGDIWRNFGVYPLFFFGAALSLILSYLSRLYDKSIILIRFPVLFLMIVWSFYIIVGNIFSLGPFAILFMISILLLVGQTRLSI